MKYDFTQDILLQLAEGIFNAEGRGTITALCHGAIHNSPSDKATLREWTTERLLTAQAKFALAKYIDNHLYALPVKAAT